MEEAFQQTGGETDMSAEYPVPSGVYYNSETDNFYSMANRCGMGLAFWTNWRGRSADFPNKAPESPADERDRRGREP